MKKPLLIIISGLPGSGKSTLAGAISKEFNIVAIGCDEIKEIISDRICNRTDKDLFDRVASSAYSLMYYFADKELRIGRGVILEAFFINKLSSHEIEQLRKDVGCHVMQIHLKASLEVVEKRYKDRADNDPSRHPCHAYELPVLARSCNGDEKVEIQDETFIFDTNDFSKLDYEDIFKEIRKYF